MTGKDIFKALGGLDPKIVLSAAPQEETGAAKVKPSSNMWIKLGALAAAIIVLILAVPLIADLLPSGDGGYVADSYSEVFDQCDLAVFGTYKGKTEKLTYSEYTFEVNDVLKGEVTKKEIAVRSEKKSIFSEDEMEKHSQEASAGFKEGEEYFLALKSSSKGVIDFISQQIISINDIESGSVSADFGAFLEENGISIDITREELKNFFEYIFGGASDPNEDTKPDPEPQGTEGIIYELAEDGASYVVTRYESYSSKVIIPSSYEGLPVTEIGAEAFQYSNISEVFIPGSVSKIGKKAFFSCINLKRVRMEEGVTSIEAQAFGNNPYLAEVNIPDSIRYVGAEVFWYCTDLEFNEYEGGRYLGNENSKYLVLMDVLKGEEESIKIHLDTRVIGARAFINNRAIKTLAIPYNVVSICDYAFSGCFIKELTVPEGVESIGNGAFSSCHALTRVNLPSTLKTIGGDAFSTCRVLEELRVAENNPIYYSEGNCLITKADKIVVVGCVGSVIPNNVLGIGDRAFSGYDLKTIAIPNSVTTIGEGAFDGSDNLTSIIIPENVTVLNRTFVGCQLLSNVTLPKGLKEIGNATFSSCSALRNIDIPDTVEIIGESAFDSCINLSEIDIPQSVSKLGRYAFKNCKSLKSVDIKNSQIELVQTFINCEYLSSVKLPEGLKEIGVETFLNCRSLKSIVFPESITAIGDRAFYGCIGLRKVLIPEGVDTLGIGAFGKCADSTYEKYENGYYIGKAGNPYYALVEPVSEIIQNAKIHPQTQVIENNVFGVCYRMKELFVFKDIKLLSPTCVIDNVSFSVYFDGTVDEWSAFLAQSCILGDNCEYTVICTDGTITK